MAAANSAAARSAQIFVASTTVTVTQSSNTLAMSLGGVVNGASYTTPVAPGSIAAVFGNFLLAGPVQAATLPAPFTIQGLSLQFGSVPAPLLYASSGQAAVQVPWELANQTQSTITALKNGQISAPQTVTLATYAPAILAINGQGTGQGAILDGNYQLLDWSNPGIAGVTVGRCTGLGPVTNQPPTGAASPANPLAMTTTEPQVTIAGNPASILFSGLAPGYVGLYQVDALITGASDYLDTVTVTLSIGGVQSNMVTITAH